MIDFVKSLQGLKKKYSFAFISYGTQSGDCGNWIRRTLIRKGSRDLGYFKSFGRDYWSGYIKKGVLFSPDSPSTEELASAEEFGKALTVS